MTLAARGLLVEEQRTNLLLWSAEFDNASWTVAGAGTGSAPVVTANDAIAPDGTMTADKVVFDRGAGNSSSDRSFLQRSVTLTASATYTDSFWIKAATAGDVGKQLAYRSVAGAGYQTITLTDSWQRLALTEAAAGVSSTVEWTSRGTISTSNVVGVHLWGAQLELGSFATSYIPTAAASVTRNADVASVGVSQFPYSTTEGSIVANVTPINVSAARRAVQIDDGTENERYTLSTNSTPNGLFTVIDGGSLQVAIATGTPAANTNIKLAARYKVNDFALSVNGGAVSTDTTGTLPTANLLMRLGSGVSSVELINGHIRQITYIPRALTNAELIARSG